MDVVISQSTLTASSSRRASSQRLPFNRIGSIAHCLQPASCNELRDATRPRQAKAVSRYALAGAVSQRTTGAYLLRQTTYHVNRQRAYCPCPAIRSWDISRSCYSQRAPAQLEAEPVSVIALNKRRNPSRFWVTWQANEPCGKPAVRSYCSIQCTAAKWMV